MGTDSSGGVERKKYPTGVWVKFANFSSCFRVGRTIPFSQSWNFGNFLSRPSIPTSARLQAHCNSSGFMSTRTTDIDSRCRIDQWDDLSVPNLRQLCFCSFGSAWESVGLRGLAEMGTRNISELQQTKNKGYSRTRKIIVHSHFVV